MENKSREKEKREETAGRRMKITAGLGSVDDYVRFVQAGADECFCGYVPYEWSRKYGTVMPANRREVLCVPVQLGAFSELEILAAMVKQYQKPVHLTFNALSYLPEQYPELAAIIRRCMKLGFLSYIIADPALIIYLRQQNIACEIHLSGEMGEMNRGTAAFFQQFQMKRIIFHRKVPIQDMQSVIAAERAAGGWRTGTEFEAFVLNELCQFTGAFCSSLHCDELGHLCRVPYWPGPVKDKQEPGVQETETCADSIRPMRSGKGKLQEMAGNPEADQLWHRADTSDSESERIERCRDTSGYLCGESGCGLCALYRLQQAGITHLKVVGRGNYRDFMEKDIRNLRRALTILAQSATREAWQKRMKQEMFPHGCSRNCYYVEEGSR